MTHYIARPKARLTLLLALASLLTACQSGEGQGGVRSTVVAPPANGTPKRIPDSASLARPLALRGATLDSVLAVGGPYAAVMATDSSGRRVLAAIDTRGPTPTLLGEPDELFEGYVPDLVQWLALGEQGVNALLYSYEQTVEGVIGTTIRRVEGKRLPVIYGDPAYICTSARVRDLDGDGTPELLAYPEDPSRGDCSSFCHAGLIDRFGMGPAWVRVYRWTGSEWAPAEERFPEFYARLFETYTRMEQWIRDSARGGDPMDARVAACHRAGRWFREDLFTAWKQRAAALAGGAK